MSLPPIPQDGLYGGRAVAAMQDHGGRLFTLRNHVNGKDYHLIDDTRAVAMCQMATVTGAGIVEWSIVPSHKVVRLLDEGKWCIVAYTTPQEQLRHIASRLTDNPLVSTTMNHFGIFLGVGTPVQYWSIAQTDEPLAAIVTKVNDLANPEVNATVNLYVFPDAEGGAPYAVERVPLLAPSAPKPPILPYARMIDRLMLESPDQASIPPEPVQPITKEPKPVTVKPPSDADPCNTTKEL